MRFLFLIFVIILTSCFNKNYKVDEFTNDELIWYKPFTKTDTIIFTSGKSEMDTIIFKKPKFASDSSSDFERGFSKRNYLTVNYDFTKGSYHQFAIMGDGKTRYDSDFVNTSKSSLDYTSVEIGFIGTLFSSKIDKVEKINDSTYFFASKNADYIGMNVEKGINSFTFNTRLGILEFVDDRNVKWTRK